MRTRADAIFPTAVLGKPTAMEVNTAPATPAPGKSADSATPAAAPITALPSYAPQSTALPGSSAGADADQERASALGEPPVPSLPPEPNPLTPLAVPPNMDTRADDVPAPMDLREDAATPAQEPLAPQVSQLPPMPPHTPPLSLLQGMAALVVFFIACPVLSVTPHAR